MTSEQKKRKKEGQAEANKGSGQSSPNDTDEKVDSKAPIT